MPSTRVRTNFSLTLQLPFCFEVRALSNRLVSSTPEGPCDDVCGENAVSCEPLRYSMDFLNRPADKGKVFRLAPDAVFFVAGCLAWRRIAAIIAKASMTNET